MSNDPLLVDFDKLVELIRGLGLDPVDPNDIRKVTIDGLGVEVIRYRRTESGGLHIGFNNQPLTETVLIGMKRADAPYVAGHPGPDA